MQCGKDYDGDSQTAEMETPRDLLKNGDIDGKDGDPEAPPPLDLVDAPLPSVLPPNARHSSSSVAASSFNAPPPTTAPTSSGPDEVKAGFIDADQDDQDDQDDGGENGSILSIISLQNQGKENSSFHHRNNSSSQEKTTVDKLKTGVIDADEDDQDDGGENGSIINIISLENHGKENSSIHHRNKNSSQEMSVDAKMEEEVVATTPQMAPRDQSYNSNIIANDAQDATETRSDSPAEIDARHRAATQRRSIGAFRVFPDERRIERAGRDSEDAPPTSSPVAQTDLEVLGDNDDHQADLEGGGLLMNGDLNLPHNALVSPTLEAALVEDLVVEAHPIHLTHVPISSVQHDRQQEQRNKDNKDESPRGIVGTVMRQKRPVSCGLLIIGMAAAAWVGVYAGSKGRNYDSVAEGVGGGSLGLNSTVVEAEDEEGGDGLLPQAEIMVPSSTEGLDQHTTASQDHNIVSNNDNLHPKIWEQVGSNIVGESPKDRSGFSVATSSSGTVIAIGSPQSDAVDEVAGLVRIFAWNATLNDWSQRGTTLLGEFEGDKFGYSVSLSGSGDTLVVGAPFHETNDSGQATVYQWNGALEDYVVRGTLHELRRYTWERWGWDVKLSEDGNTVALSSLMPEDAPGDLSMTGGLSMVKMFKWNDDVMDWSENYMLELYTKAEVEGSGFGHSIGLSADGQILSVGAIHRNGPNGEADVGKTRVFKYDNDLSDLVQLGSGIYGEAARDWSGYSTDLSADGNILAVSAPVHDGVNGEESGHVRVYSWDDLIADWVPMGSDIYGKDKFDRFGHMVSLAGDGRTIAITSHLNSDNGLRSGHCRVFHWSNSMQDWMQVGEDIQGEENYRIRAVAFNSDGSRLVVGAWGAESATGHVRVFDWSQQEGGDFPFE